MEISEEVQRCMEGNAFIKINGTTWVNPCFIEKITHKPRHIFLTNKVCLKISRRSWYRCKNISEKGDAT